MAFFLLAVENKCEFSISLFWICWTVIFLKNMSNVKGSPALRELFNANSSFIDVVSRFILVISVDFDTSVVWFVYAGVFDNFVCNSRIE